MQIRMTGELAHPFISPSWWHPSDPSASQNGFVETLCLVLEYKSDAIFWNIDWNLSYFHVHHIEYGKHFIFAQYWRPKSQVHMRRPKKRSSLFLSVDSLEFLFCWDHMLSFVLRRSDSFYCWQMQMVLAGGSDVEGVVDSKEVGFGEIREG